MALRQIEGLAAGRLESTWARAARASIVPNPPPVGEIAGRLRLHQPQVSKHLRVLHEAGLVEVRSLAQLQD